jgi:hypothetical protein
MRKLVYATVSAALCLSSVAPAMAQDARLTGLDAPRGATATVNFRVPLGGAPQQAERQMSYGLTLSYGQPVGAPMLDGRTMRRAINLADFRFEPSGELRNARVASFDLANLDQDRRLNLAGGGGKKSLLVIAGLVAAGVAVCLLAECFEGDSDSSDSSSSN